MMNLQIETLGHPTSTPGVLGRDVDRDELCAATAVVGNARLLPQLLLFVYARQTIT